MMPFTALRGLSAIDNKTVTIVIICISVAFLSILLIFLFSRYVIPLFRRVSAGTKARGADTVLETEHGEKTGDVNAAIAMALYLYLNETHDEESNVITIRRVSRTYSPWSSKLYSMRNLR